MGKILFEHNRKAYEAAVCLMEETGRAAVIHPTGTGKSFIAFQLCADHPQETICWLSPSEYIYRTQKEKWFSACGNAACGDGACRNDIYGNVTCGNAACKNAIYENTAHGNDGCGSDSRKNTAGGQEIENIRFFTYAKLMRMEEKELREIAPSYIILDEFHRCGAAQWGSGVERLREMYPQARVLGLSATNIRYLDNQRDMAWELFGGNIASELTLGAAIARGILPTPKYVLSVYSYQEELSRYAARLRRAKNKAVRDTAEKELEALRRALEKADGLEDIFARHMVPSDSAGFGKYIVFCASFEHLNEMKELASEWFAKVDVAPHIYTVYSDDPAASQEFAAFKADESKHLKLLYCIDMLNEGIHVGGLTGVILLRPTVSPTIYKQQIGRAFAAGGNAAAKVPVIFDIVMNIENLCSIGAMEEELREAVFSCRARGEQEEIVKEHFQIIDEVGDCRKLFRQLNETLGASWDVMYEMAKEYYAAHGNLEVPARYATASGYSLGAWLTTQRKVYTGRTAGSLSVEQIKRLNAIGMVWEDKSNASWEKSYAAACEYFREHGDLEVPAAYVTADGTRLGRWIRRQKEVYREVMRQGREGYSGGIAEGISGKREYEDEIIEEVSSKQGQKYADGITEEVGSKRKYVDEIVGEISGKQEHTDEITEEVSSKQNQKYAERFKKLEKIGIIWENGDPWEKRFALAKKYFEEHGNLKMPADYIAEGVWLERWLREQKAKLAADEKTGKPLTAEQKEKLHSIGISPGASQAELSWRRQYGEAEEFYREHGNLSVPKRYAARNGKNLGVWLQRQRAGRRNGHLAGWQVQMLDGIGMVWELEDPWETGFWHAGEYFAANGHLAVPNNYICADGYRLGKWISNQRCAYGGSAKRGLKEEQVRKLEEIGMQWSAKPGRRGSREKEEVFLERMGREP